MFITFQGVFCFEEMSTLVTERCLSFLIGLIVLLAAPSSCYIVLVDSYGEECFHEHALNGTLLQLTFQVLSGGFLDIDLVMADPTGALLVHRRRAAYGAHALTALLHGRYYFCFHNAHSSKVPKLVKFDFDMYDLDLERELSASQNDLEAMVKTAGYRLRQIKREAEYLENVSKNHFFINENSNLAILVWALIEYTLIVTLCVWQRYYLLKFFEVRRYV